MNILTKNYQQQKNLLMMNRHSQNFNNTCILHLSLIDGIGPATIKTIIHCKPHTASWHDIYHFTHKDWCELGLSENSAHKVVTGLSDSALLECELALIEKHKVSWLTNLDERYPSLLNHIYIPPAVLYCKGAMFDVHHKMIAIVGSRKADSYAQEVIDSLVPTFVANDWSIVSGGALGADSMAHKAALGAGGKTVVVLGSGLLQPYPYSNKHLFDEIIEHGGTLVSSFPLTASALPGNFPARNRIIAGLSKGCIVVQAAYKSGANITAQYALEQGREVFAVPGTINHELSAGCHALIKEGAQLVTSAQEVLFELGETMVHKVDQKSPQEKQTKTDSVAYQPARPVPKKALSQSAYPPTSIQAKIISVCAQPVALDELVQLFDVALPELQSLIFELQLEGVIAQNFAGQWVAR
jgi:DNA protecting protein DprA